MQVTKDFGDLLWIAADSPVHRKRFLGMGGKKGKRREKRGKRGKRRVDRKRKCAIAHTFRGKGEWGFFKCANPGPRPRIRSVLGKTGRMPRLLRLRIARRERRRRGDEADVARGVGIRSLLVRVRSPCFVFR